MTHYKIQPLTARRLPEILQLQEAVFATLEQPGLLRRNSPEMLERCLARPHLTLGAIKGEQLAAIAIMFDPAEEPDEDLAHLLQCPEVTGMRVANFKLCIVHPDHRGRRLQQQLGLEIEKAAQKKGIQMLCSTVAPTNEASRHSLEKIGYRSDCLIEKYGHPRELFYKILG